MDRTLGEWGRKGIGHWVNGDEGERTVRNRNRRKEECPGMGKNKKRD